MSVTRRIYIQELAEIVNRKMDTIRRWESRGLLPKRLKPRRGEMNRRYWTHAQVYGKNGIIVWMKENDMRPGRLMAAPEMEEQMVANMRRPKFLDMRDMQLARRLIGEGRSAISVARTVHRRHIKRKKFNGDLEVTPLGYVKLSDWYSSAENVEAALRKAFELEGEEFPTTSEGKLDGESKIENATA